MKRKLIDRLCRKQMLNTEYLGLESIFINKKYISIDDMIEKLQELDSESEELREKYADLVSDVEDNYERIPISRQVGIYDEDFR